MSRTVLYEIITSFAQHGFPKIVMGVHKTQRMVSALTFLERHHKDGNEFFGHILRVTGDETWVSFVNVETKSSQSSLCTHIHQTSRKSLNKRCLPES
jgi:hypothetical protein